MKYLPISPQLFTKNRLKFSKQMQPKSIAVFNSNDVFSTGADSTLPFEQHRNIFYLSGVDQEESILILFPSATEVAHREILFVKETNDHIAVWEGAKLSKSQATAASEIQTVYWLKEFDSVFPTLIAEASSFYFNNNNHYRQTVEMETRDDRFLKMIKSVSETNNKKIKPFTDQFTHYLGILTKFSGWISEKTKTEKKCERANTENRLPSNLLSLLYALS